MGIGGDVAVRPFGDLAAEIEHHAAIGDALDDPHLMLDDDDSQILVALAHQENVVHQLGGLVMRHARRGLVEQQQFRLADQRAANLDPAAIDHRQPGNRLKHPVCKRRLEDLDQRARGMVARFKFTLEVAALDQIEPEPLMQALVVSDHDVVEDRQRQRQTRPLEGAGNSRPIDRARRNACDVGAVERHAPRIGGMRFPWRR